MDTYNVFFKGYRREEKIATLPSYSGIYMVYTCVYNETDSTVSLKNLIYIGQAENLNDKINNHELKDQFNEELQPGEQLCYAYAQMEVPNLNIVENALIFSQKPKLNSRYKRSFNYPASHFIIDGKCALLNNRNFTIE